jgi:hypothetical protein
MSNFWGRYAPLKGPLFMPHICGMSWSPVKFPKVWKFAKALWTKLKQHKRDAFHSQVDLPTNATRATNLISPGLLQMRKYMDKIDVYPELVAFGKTDSRKVYIIKNDREYDGLDIYLLDHLFNYLGSKSNRTEEHRKAGSRSIRLFHNARVCRGGAP